MSNFAIIRVETVTVCCPGCGENKGNPHNGSHMWSLEDIVAANQGTACGDVKCDSCGRNFHVHAPKRIAADYNGAV